MMIGILQALLLVAFGIPILIFCLYGGIVLYYGKLKKVRASTDEPEKATEFEPFVTVIVPTHDEGTIVSKKIENLRESSYPWEKLEIIFVDDSSDSTPDIIEEYSKRYPNIRLIRFRERMGYSPSMVAGCKAAEGDIIILNDAGSFLDADAISNLVTRFQNPNIGVVTGNDAILNVNETVGKSEALYQKIYNFLRESESNMDSTFYIKGEATAVRQDAVSDLETCNETFDTTVGLLVRQKGYKVVYDPNAKFYEYAPLTHFDRVQQKTIRAANLVKVLWRFRHMMFKRRYGKFGCVILPMNFAMIVIAPLTILIGFVFLVALTLLDMSYYAMVWAALGSVLLLLLIASRHLVFTFLEFEYSLLKALYQLAFTTRTHDKIDKVASTRRY